MGSNEKKKVESALTDKKVCRSSPTTGGFATRDITEDVRLPPSSEPNVVPSIIPCYDGKSIKIHEELVVNGLSAISIKHFKGNCNEGLQESSASETSADDRKKKTSVSENRKGGRKKKAEQTSSQPALHREDTFNCSFDKRVPDCLNDKMKNRNSFWNVDRPELSKLTWPQNYISSAVLQDFFHHHLRTHGTFCEYLHEINNPTSLAYQELRDYSRLREIVPPRILPPDEKIINIVEKSRSVQLNDQDLDPGIIVHKSRAEFRVTIGEYVRRPPSFVNKKAASEQLTKIPVPSSTGRMESLPLQHEGLLAKNILESEERISTVIGNNTVRFRRFDDRVTDDSGDHDRLRTILNPRDEENPESGSLRNTTA